VTLLHGRIRLRGAALLLVACAALPALAAGDPARGERVFQLCAACHAAEGGAEPLQGPPLKGIVGAPIAAWEGFEYSPALSAFARTQRAWSEDLLDRYLAAPYRIVPKTTMSFPGLQDAQERADVIAYLKSLR
jgi:cytochrome c